MKKRITKTAKTEKKAKTPLIQSQSENDAHFFDPPSDDDYTPVAIPLKNIDLTESPDDPDIQDSIDIKVNAFERVYEPRSRKIKWLKAKHIILLLFVIAIAVLFLWVIEVGNLNQRLASPVSIRGQSIPHDEFSFMYAYVLIENGVDILDPETPELLASPLDGDFDTLRDFFLDVTAKELQTTAILYDDARANGYEMNASHIERAQAYLDWLQMKADAIHVELDIYIRGVFGPHVTPSLILDVLSKRYFAEEYASGPKLDALRASDDQAEESYLASRNQYDIISYRVLRIIFEQREPSFISTAHLHAHEIIDRMDGNDSQFERIAADFFSGEERERLLEPNATLVSNVRYQHIDDIEWRTWLFDHNRVPGDATIFEDEHGFPIIVCFSSRQRQSEPLRNIRILFIQRENTEAGIIGFSRNEIMPLAQSIYDSIDGETALISLETIYSDEINSGIMISTQSSDTYKGKYDEYFDIWIFDDERMPGDKTIIETSTQVAILYYVGTSENPEWFDRVNSFIRMNNYQAFLMEKQSEYPIEFNEEGLKHI